MMKLSVLEKLQQTNADAEIWWDSSPLVFASWRDEQVRKAPDNEARDHWIAQLDRFLNPDDPSRSLVRGVTTNPSLIAKSIISSPELWGREVQNLARYQTGQGGQEMFWLVYLEAVRRAAEFMFPMWASTGGRYGWVSGQIDPRDMFDADRMMEQAMQIARLAPNLMVKVPGTRQGYEVIRRLAARGISVNNTCSYTVPQFVTCIRAVETGLDEARRQGIDLSRWRCVITHMIGRFGSQGDLIAQADVRDIALCQAEVRWAEIAILKRIHNILSGCTAPIKMLLSSLQMDDPTIGSATLSMHLQETAGANIIYTCKPEFIEKTMIRAEEVNQFDCHAIERSIPKAVMEKLERLPYFRQAFEPDGMLPENFGTHGAFLATQAEVNCWMRRLIDFTDCQMQVVSGRTRRSMLQVAAE